MVAICSTIVAVAVLVVYLAYFLIKKGVPVSLSDTFYRGMGYIFTLMCFIVGISTAMGLFDLTEGEWYQFFAFFSAAGLLFVGAAPMFKERGMEHTVHITGAVLCGVASQVVVILSGYWYITVILIPFLLLVRNSLKRTFWFEMAAFLSTFTAMWFMIFNR